MKQPHWAVGKRDTIAEFLRQGMSAGQIAPTFGVSRNAVIGVVHRDKALREIGFKQKGGYGPAQAAARGLKFTAPKAVQRLPPKPKPSLVRLPPAPVVEVGIVHTVGVPMMMLEGCKWPVNDPIKGDLHLFCNAPVQSGPWCACHRRQSVSKGTHSERDAARVLRKAA